MGAKCLFCDNPANSKEHLWPAWILEGIQPYSKRLLSTRGDDPPREIGAIGKTNVTVKSVCKICNHGWMSDLETESRPILSPMIHDLVAPLSDQQRHVIARWAVKTAIVLGSATQGRKPIFYWRPECESLCRDSTVPEHTLVWLGHYVRSDLGAWGSQMWLDMPNQSKVAHGCVTTLVVGHLAIQALTIHVRPEYRDKAISFRPNSWGFDWDDILCRVWPIAGSITWPPSLSFQSTGVFSIGSLVVRWRPV
jgi:hypothetical protein